jgi:mannosyltransferase OCH1-like enzyme
MPPKSIYLTYSKKEDLEYPKQCWTILNPGWTVQTFDNTESEEFLRTTYGQLYADIFQFIPDGPIKADFWRVCILYKYGGLYVDADIEPLVGLDSYLEKNISFATVLSYLRYYNPHFIFANAGEPLLKKCIDIYVDYYTRKEPYSYWGWSIVNIFTIPHLTKKKESGVYIYSGQKIQLLKEELGSGRYDMHCSYKGKRVLNNRFKNYDDTKHCFT